jgi:hypothetical protein
VLDERTVQPPQVAVPTLSAAMVGELLGSMMPNPDDPGDPDNPLGPFGPGGPVLRDIVSVLAAVRSASLIGDAELRGTLQAANAKALSTLAGRLEQVGLNPQPLPPRQR